MPKEQRIQKANSLFDQRDAYNEKFTNEINAAYHSEDGDDYNSACAKAEELIAEAQKENNDAKLFYYTVGYARFILSVMPEGSKTVIEKLDSVAGLAINDIEKAKLSDWLTRAQLAKMMSQYMTNVLWKTPAETEKVEYADVDESLGDLADFIQTAYAYKIMWINADGTPLENFNPNGQVTRAEYATVFSRVLYGDKYNKSEWNYYEDHLAALKEAGILTNTTPTIQEIRWWVMLMMYRSVNTEPTEETTQIANPASEYCVAQWGTVNIVKDDEWNESGICKLADGTEVDEREYFRENNKETETWATTEEPIEDTEWTGNVASWSTLTVTATPGKENNN